MSGPRSASFSCRARATSSPPWARWPRWPTTSAFPGAPAPWLSRASTAAASAPPTRSPTATCTSRSSRIRTTSRSTARRASSSASTARWSRSSSSSAATTAASRPSSARSSSRAPLADTAGYSPDLTYDQKVELLEILDVTERLRRALELQRERLTEMQVRRQIRDDVQSGAEKQQREYFLRKQMESIQKELGDDDGSVVEEYRTEDRRGRHAGRGPRAGRARAEPVRAHGRAVGRELDDPLLPRLADRRAVVAALRRAARPGARA